MSGMAHFFVVVSGSKIHERVAHFFIDIYTLEPRWILRTLLVAEMGFEPHDLRVMRIINRFIFI